MKFRQWLENKEERQAQWARKKAQKDSKTEKKGYVAGNPRYGKSGTGIVQGHPEKHRSAQNQKDLES